MSLHGQGILFPIFSNALNTGLLSLAKKIMVKEVTERETVSKC